MVDLNVMRQDFLLTAEREGWSDADVEEIGAAIKAEIDAGNAEALAGWAKSLALWREMLESYAPRLRAFEAKVRADAEAQRRVAA